MFKRARYYEYTSFRFEYAVTANQLSLYEKVCSRLLRSKSLSKMANYHLNILKAILFYNLEISKVEGNDKLYYLSVDKDLYSNLEVFDVASAGCKDPSVIAKKCIGFID